MTLIDWTPTITTVVGFIFLAGQVTGRIKDQEKTIKDHHEKLGDHDEKLGEHSIAIAESRAWRSGYDAARSTQRKDDRA